MYVTPVSMMGIALPASPLLLLPNNTDAGNLAVRFRIKSGDPEGFFKAEAQRVGDFVFLSLRTRSSNLNVLNRERTPRYRLEVSWE